MTLLEYLVDSDERLERLDLVGQDGQDAQSGPY